VIYTAPKLLRESGRVGDGRIGQCHSQTGDDVSTVSWMKLGVKSNWNNRHADVVKVCWGSATDTVIYHQYCLEGSKYS